MIAAKITKLAGLFIIDLDFSQSSRLQFARRVLDDAGIAYEIKEQTLSIISSASRLAKLEAFLKVYNFVPFEGMAECFPPPDELGKVSLTDIRLEATPAAYARLGYQDPAISFLNNLPRQVDCLFETLFNAERTPEGSTQIIDGQKVYALPYKHLGEKVLHLQIMASKEAMACVLDKLYYAGWMNSAHMNLLRRFADGFSRISDYDYYAVRGAVEGERKMKEFDDKPPPMPAKMEPAVQAPPKLLKQKRQPSLFDMAARTQLRLVSFAVMHELLATQNQEGMLRFTALPIAVRKTFKTVTGEAANFHNIRSYLKASAASIKAEAGNKNLLRQQLEAITGRVLAAEELAQVRIFIARLERFISAAATSPRNDLSQTFFIYSAGKPPELSGLNTSGEILLGKFMRQFAVAPVPGSSELDELFYKKFLAKNVPLQVKNAILEILRTAAMDEPQPREKVTFGEPVAVKTQASDEPIAAKKAVMSIKTAPQPDMDLVNAAYEKYCVKAEDRAQKSIETLHQHAEELVNYEPEPERHWPVEPHLVPHKESTIEPSIEDEGTEINGNHNWRALANRNSGVISGRMARNHSFEENLQQNSGSRAWQAAYEDSHSPAGRAAIKLGFKR